MFIPIESFTLPNGLTVLHNEDHTLPVVAMELWVDAGSMYETPTNNGISHFLEHLAFKGTQRYPGTKISYIIEEVGGMINAATSMDCTYYYVELMAFAAERGFSVLSQMAHAIQLDAHEVEREKNVVAEEIVRGTDSPEHTMWETMFAHVFKGHPYQQPVIGTRENILRCTPQDIETYYQTYYTPRRMALMVSGALSRTACTELLNRFFTFEHTSSLAPCTTPSPYIPSSKKSTIITHSMPTLHETYYALVWHIPSSFTDDVYALECAAYVLGKGISSRLHQDVKEKQQLVWSISAEVILQRKGSLFLVSGTMDYAKRDAAVAAIMDILRSVTNTKHITHEELLKVQEMIHTDFWNSVETCSGRAYMMGHYAMLGEYGVINEFLPTIDRVCPDDIARVVGKYCDDSSAMIYITPEHI